MEFEVFLIISMICWQAATLTALYFSDRKLKYLSKSGLGQADIFKLAKFKYLYIYYRRKEGLITKHAFLCMIAYYIINLTGFVAIIILYVSDNSSLLEVVCVLVFFNIGLFTVTGRSDLAPEIRYKLEIYMDKEREKRKGGKRKKSSPEHPVVSQMLIFPIISFFFAGIGAFLCIITLIGNDTILIGTVLLTPGLFFGIATTRWRITIMENEIIYTPFLGKTRTISFGEIKCIMPDSGNEGFIAYDRDRKKIFHAYTECRGYEYLERAIAYATGGTIQVPVGNPNAPERKDHSNEYYEAPDDIDDLEETSPEEIEGEQ